MCHETPISGDLFHVPHLRGDERHSVRVACDQCDAFDITLADA
jgi:hypothetical protein